VAFQLLFAKLIPIVRRGRLQALRNASGGLVAAGLAWAAGRYIIQRNLFGNGYGTTFLLAFALTSLGLTGMGLLVREPEPPTVRVKSRVLDRVREFPTLLSQDRAFMFFVIAQALATAGNVAAPFYILFAGGSMPLNGQNLGLLSLAFIGSSVITNLGWGVAGDRFGFRTTLIGAVATWIGATGLLMAAPALGRGHVIDTHTLILIAFFALGAAQAGFSMSCQTMVLEFGAREDIAMRLGLTNTAQGAVAAIGPLAGGLIAAVFSYEVLFGVSISFLITALLIILLLVEEPRFRRLA
jgi:Na+/melibiose symporter-like transporter